MKKTISLLKVLLPVIILSVIYYLTLTDIVEIASNYSVKKENGLISILTGPLLHGDFKHLVGNCYSMIISCCILNYYVSTKKYLGIMLLAWIIPSILIYSINGLCTAGTIGISGLAYCLSYYIIIKGFTYTKKDNKIPLLISVMLLIFEGIPLIIGITPYVGYGISWKAHLFGAILGSLIVVYDLIFDKNEHSKSLSNKR
jgi:membrane associated rhomboid family serine protease